MATARPPYMHRLRTAERHAREAYRALEDIVTHLRAEHGTEYLTNWLAQAEVLRTEVQAHAEEAQRLLPLVPPEDAPAAELLEHEAHLSAQAAKDAIAHAAAQWGVKV